jgi:predicted  nucleic acid-binding Zn-ribbon protein
MLQGANMHAIKITRDGIFTYNVERLYDRKIVWAGRIYIEGQVVVVQGTLNTYELKLIEDNVFTILTQNETELTF